MPLDVLDRCDADPARRAGAVRRAPHPGPAPTTPPVLVPMPPQAAASSAMVPAVRGPDAVRRSTSPCPYPLRVVVLAADGADADTLLAPSPMVTVQAELAMSPRAIRELVLLGPDVAIVDLRDVPGHEVIGHLRRIHGASRRTRIVALVPDAVDITRKALIGGATACVPAQADRIAMLHAVHDAARHRLHLGGVARTLLRDAATAC